jgi:hypothetical protein
MSGKLSRTDGKKEPLSATKTAENGTGIRRLSP